MNTNGEIWGYRGSVVGGSARTAAAGIQNPQQGKYSLPAYLKRFRERAKGQTPRHALPAATFQSPCVVYEMPELRCYTRARQEARLLLRVLRRHTSLPQAEDQAGQARAHPTSAN